jgi:hypothetical protein
MILFFYGVTIKIVHTIFLNIHNAHSDVDGLVEHDSSSFHMKSHQVSCKNSHPIKGGFGD